MNLSFSHVFAHELGKRKAIQLGKQEAYFPADASLQEVLSQINLEELPLFKFETLANATSDFSEANKLGKGGFGSVYKVDSFAYSSHFVLHVMYR